MARLPADFDPNLWFDPLTFQKLVGMSLTVGDYSELFRSSDGFAKPISELKKVKWINDRMPELEADFGRWRKADAAIEQALIALKRMILACKTIEKLAMIRHVLGE